MYTDVLANTSVLENMSGWSDSVLCCHCGHVPSTDVDVVHVLYTLFRWIDLRSILVYTFSHSYEILRSPKPCIHKSSSVDLIAWRPLFAGLIPIRRDVDVTNWYKDERYTAICHTDI
jgi:hypothetical protein